MIGARPIVGIFIGAGLLALTFGVLSQSLAIASATGWFAVLILLLIDQRRSAPLCSLVESAVVHARDAVVILGPVSRPEGGRPVLYVNAAFTQMTGYSYGEVVGGSLRRLLGDRTDPATLDRLRRALDAGQPYNCELFNVSRQGVGFWVELVIEPVRLKGRLSHWVMIQRDISDRKHALQSLEAQERQLRSIGDAIPDGAVYQIELSPTGVFRCRYISRGIESMLGLTPHEIYRDIHAMDSCIHPDDLVPVQQINISAAANLSEFDVHFRARRVHGEEWRHIHSRGTPERLADGSVLWNGVMIDTTEAVRTAEQLRQAERLTVIGRLAGGTAHQFNNLLTALMGSLDQIRLADDDPRQVHITVAMASARRAARLVEMLLATARQSRLVPHRVDVAQLVTDAMRDWPGGNGIDVQVEVPSDLAVEGDFSLLSQALVNLLTNAAEAIERHGSTGQVSISARVVCQTHTDSQRRGTRPGEYVAIIVADTGPGVDPSLAAHLFEPFYVLHSAGEEVGLSLPMVEGIVRQHGGWVEYAPGGAGSGAVFMVHLPPATEASSLRPQLRQEPATPFPLTEAFGQGRLILVAEDDDDIRNLVQNILEQAGFKVVTAVDGHEALSLCRQHGDRLSLIVLDLVMPRLDGHSVIDQLQTEMPNLPVVLSSGYSVRSVESSHRPLRRLTKPWGSQELLESVRGLLNP